MKTKLIRLALILTVSIACVGEGTQKRVPDSAIREFQKFWGTFREAVVAGRCDDLAGMASFPFKTRGPLDSDPVKEHAREVWGALCPLLLDSDPGLSEQRQTMKAHIQRKTAVSALDFSGSSGSVRVANFVFKKVGGAWKFVFAYSEE